MALHNLRPQDYIAHAKARKNAIDMQGLTPAGVAHSWVLGTTVYSAFGAGGYALVCLYFVFGSAVTKLKLSQKQVTARSEAEN